MTDVIGGRSVGLTAAVDCIQRLLDPRFRCLVRD